MPALHVSHIDKGITSLAELDDLSEKTRSVSLHCNMLRSLSGLHRFVNLQEVVASNNYLTSLGSLTGLNSLTSLNVSSNQLESISEICCLRELRTLNLAYNNISKLQPFAVQGSLCKLQKLDVSSNKLNLLSQLSCLAHLHRLEDLGVEGQVPQDGMIADFRAVQAAIIAALPQVGSSVCGTRCFSF